MIVLDSYIIKVAVRLKNDSAKELKQLNGKNKTDKRKCTDGNLDNIVRTVILFTGKLFLQ